MKTTSWRITKEKLASDAFSGEGARLSGGRWNSAGTPLIYTAASNSLAALELMVHLSSTIDILNNYVIIKCEFGENLVEALDPGDLPENWRGFQPRIRIQSIGDQWIAEARSAILKVPSAVIPIESNYLFSPEHPDYSKIDIHQAERILPDQIQLQTSS